MTNDWCTGLQNLSLHDHSKTSTSKKDKAQEARHLLHGPHLACPTPAATTAATTAHPPPPRHNRLLSDASPT